MELAPSRDKSLLTSSTQRINASAAQKRVETHSEAQLKEGRRRFLPRSRTTLFLLDILFLAVTAFGLVDGLRTRLGFNNAVESQAIVASIVIASLAFMFAAGCYRYDALTNFSTAVTRLVVALSVSGLCLIVVIHFGLGLIFHSLAFRSFSREVTIILLAEGAGVTGGIISRVLFLAMARRHWFRRGILVIGTGHRAKVLRDLFTRTERYLSELHFVNEEYLGGATAAHASVTPMEFGEEELHASYLAKKLEYRSGGRGGGQD